MPHPACDGILSLLHVSRSRLNNIWQSLRQPAFLLDMNGLVVDQNSGAMEIFDDDFMIRHGRICMRDHEARTNMQRLIGQLETKSLQATPSAELVIVRRRDKFPIILRLWPIEPGPCGPFHHVSALVTLNALGPQPGPSGANVAQTFQLTPAEARLACIMARGAAPASAAKELNISFETARKQLKSIFAKTGTHRQSELVALLMQVP